MSTQFDAFQILFDSDWRQEDPHSVVLRRKIWAFFFNFSEFSGRSKLFENKLIFLYTNVAMAETKRKLTIKLF